jgi:hypothetical protein
MIVIAIAILVLILVLVWKLVFHPVKTITGIFRVIVKVTLFCLFWAVFGWILQLTGN